MKIIFCPDSHGKIHKLSRDSIINRIAVYGIFFHSEKVLLVKDSHSQKWELPGGGLEEKEDEKRCLFREFKEETGLLIINKGKYVDSFYEYYFDTISKEAWCTNRIFYLIEKVKGKIEQSGNQIEVSQIMFHSISKLDNIPMAKRIRRIIHQSYI